MLFHNSKEKHNYFSFLLFDTITMMMSIEQNKKVIFTIDDKQ